MQRRTVLQMLAAFPAVEVHKHEPPATTERVAPIYFPPSEYRLLGVLCDIIIPGAKDAGAPQFIDLLASENSDYQRRLSGGLLWLEAACATRFQLPFLECSSDQKGEVLDLIAYRASAEKDPTLLPGIQFFALLRDLVVDGFFTSRAGIDYLEFRGNQPLTSFPGCPKIVAPA